MSKAKAMDDQDRLWNYVKQRYPLGLANKKPYDTMEDMVTPRQRRRWRKKRGEG